MGESQATPGTHSLPLPLGGKWHSGDSIDRFLCIMPASEIDAIFAGGAAASGSSSSSTYKLRSAEPESTISKTEKKKSNKKKNKRKAVDEGEESLEDKKVKAVKGDTTNTKAKEESKTKKVNVPETIIDPSSIIQAKMKKKKVEKKPKLSEADEEFRDSRGSIRKRTEDGFLIYSAEELQIDENSGGTPLCPFDCDCCH